MSTEAPFPAEPRTITPYEADELIALSPEELGALDAARLSATSAVTVARFLERRELEERRVVLRKLDTENASAVLAEMHAEDASEVIGAMREPRAVAILQELDPDDAADLFNELEETEQDRLLSRLTPEQASTMRDLIAYDPETAGGVMNPNVATVLESLTVDDAINEIRRLQEDLEVVFYVYVVDEANRLQGVVSMRDLILARPRQLIRDIMIREVRGAVDPQEDRENVALTMAELNLQALPVVTSSGQLLGIVTHDDVLDIIQQEATEDIQRLVGAGADESVHDRVMGSLKSRGPWLFVNLLTAILASYIIYLFDDQIAQMTLLAVFMPIVASMGGNTGAQTLAVAIRSIALGEVESSETWAICLREAAKGLLNGVLIGVIFGVGAGLWQGWAVGLVSGVAVVATMLFAGFCGAGIPLLLKKLKLDPAQSSSIFLTTFTDISGFGIFLGLAALFLV